LRQPFSLYVYAKIARRFYFNEKCTSAVGLSQKAQNCTAQTIISFLQVGSHNKRKARHGSFLKTLTDTTGKY